MNNKIIKKAYNTLEYNRIIEKLQDCALSDNVKARLGNLKPHLREIDAVQAINETTEAKKVIECVGTPPIATMSELETVILAVEKHAMLLPEQLEMVSQFIATCRRMQKYLLKAETIAPSVAGVAYVLVDLSDLAQIINESIRAGQVDDRASSTLANVRKKMIVLNDKIKQRLESTLKANKQYLSDHVITIRNGRFTLAVKKEYKNRINGTVVDASNSGNTVFIEPAIINRFQDEKAELEIEEDNEIRRILYTLTAMVEDEVHSIKRNSEAMESLDFMFAKAKLSIKMNGVAAKIAANETIELVEARHPLLEVDEVVPLNFKIGYSDKDEEFIRRVVITGPNTGGKTVALKTVGLLALMAQAGLHVPAKSASVCLRNRVVADIGDGQSISENLSTFSSHMTNIIHILDNINHQSLVLLDELGSGTDPAEGMGIAVAILEALAQKGCLVVATTHYPQVKEFAKQQAGFVNARMAFDRQNLKPLYQLEIGEAGESCALYIAKRLGLDQALIDRAQDVAYEDNAMKTKQLKTINKKTAVKIPSIEKYVKIEINNKEESRFSLGDSVYVLPNKDLGIVYRPDDDKGMVGVQVRGEKRFVNHKRLQLLVAAKDLYPQDYDFSIIFDTVENRKARKKLSKGHHKGLQATVEEWMS